MTRAELLVAAAAALASPAPHAENLGVTTDVTLSREGTALLAPILVSIALDNRTHHVVRLRFPTADLFRVDVLRDETPVWSSLYGHRPIPVTRAIDVLPGPLKLAQLLVDGTTDDRRAFAPGAYTVRVAMLGTNFGVVVDRNVRFDEPSTIAKALASRAGTVLTIAGTPYIDGGIAKLRDESGTVRLSHAFGLHPTGRWIVRGFLDAVGDDRVFDVGRSAPAFENAPSAAPGLF